MDTVPEISNELIGDVYGLCTSTFERRDAFRCKANHRYTQRDTGQRCYSWQVIWRNGNGGKLHNTKVSLYLVRVIHTIICRVLLHVKSAIGWNDRRWKMIETAERIINYLLKCLQQDVFLSRPVQLVEIQPSINKVFDFMWWMANCPSSLYLFVRNVWITTPINVRDVLWCIM